MFFSIKINSVNFGALSPALLIIIALGTFSAPKKHESVLLQRFNPKIAFRKRCRADQYQFMMTKISS
jgi:hypothetical protein